MASSLPEIFTFADCPVRGELGETAVVREWEPCATCGAIRPPEVQFFHLALDGWSGEDCFTVMRAYAVTPRLRSALEQEGVHGIGFREMRVSKGDYWEQEGGLPELTELVIPSRLKGPSGWWTLESECAVCGEPTWSPTDRVADGLMAAVKGEVGPPREVWSDSWKGEDVFRLYETGPPVVTRKVVDLFGRLGVQGTAFHPARWVERKP